MTPTQTHWARVRHQRESLPPDNVFLVTTIASDKAPGMVVGVTSEVTREIAAQLLASLTHRLATKAEIEKFYSDAERRCQELSKIETAKKQQYSLPEELKPLLAAAMTAVAFQPQSGETPPPSEPTSKNRGGK